jgi:DNA-binding LacI/PurR family transcriptional regulator
VLRGVPGPSSATRERVLEAAARLGYRPDRTASLLARRRSRLIGVVMDVRNTFHADWSRTWTRRPSGAGTTSC